MNIQSLYTKYLSSGKVSTDTRLIAPGSIFFALKGDKFNANTFALEALNKGASHAVVDEEAYAIDDRFTLVEDALTALQQLAKHHRAQLEIPVLGLTGSNGKTTTKELVNAVLSTKFKTLATRGNLNNHIGVPLTLLSIDSSIEIAVIEMGANHLGDVALLCELANPTHGFITNIGKAHIGTFGGLDNIIRGKSELYQHLITHNGTVFINSQNELLANMAKRFPSPLFYPSKGDYYEATFIEADPFVHVQAANGETIKTHLLGGYNFENMAVSLCIGKYFDVDAHCANEAIANYVPANMRSQMIQRNTNTIILDAYNANPTSMQAAIENLNAMKAKNKVVILGDMYELESESEYEHRALGELIATKNFNRIYFCGELIKPAASLVKGSTYCASKGELLDELKRNPISDSTILVKASRGMGLESVVDVL